MNDSILVVDDEPNLLRMVEFTLQVEGFNVLTAETAHEGLEKIRTNHPDLVVLDVSLPDMTGIEMCQQLREHQETVSLPIIMLSARSQTQDKINGLRAGSDEYITKPIDPEELVARVQTMLSRSRSFRQAGGGHEKQGKVFAFMGSKGGVGTTTIALNVALALAQRGSETALVELHPYNGSAAYHFGHSPDRTLSGLVQLETDLIDPQQLDIHLTTHEHGLRILHAPQKPQEFREISPEQTETTIRRLSKMMDYTVMDLPAMPTDTTRIALQASHVLNLVIEPESSCLDAAKNILELIHFWGGIPVQIIVVNRGLSRSPIAMTDIATQLDCDILGVMTPAGELCAKAFKTKSPLLSSHPHSLATNSLLELTDKLITQYSTVSV